MIKFKEYLAKKRLETLNKHLQHYPLAVNIGDRHILVTAHNIKIRT